MAPLKTQRQITLFLIIFALIVMRGLLNYAETAAKSLGSDPLIPVTLSAASWLLSAVIIGLLLLAGWKWIRRLWNFLTEMAGEALQPETEVKAEAEPLTTVKELGLSVSSLQRNGAISREALAVAETQAQALVDVIVKLQQTAAEMSRQADNLEAVKVALQSRDVLAIKEAAGMMADVHISSLMQIASGDADPAYWQSLLEMVATHLGTCRRWQQDYSMMTARLIAETSVIKQGLLEAEAHINVSEAAQPLLTAKANVDKVVGLLKPPTLSQQPMLRG